MYVLIRDDVPPNIVPLITGHVVHFTLRTFRGSPLMKKWYESESGKLVVCKVTAAQFEEAKEKGGYATVTEIHHQEMGEIGLGFNIRRWYDEFFTSLPLYTV